MLIVPDIHGRDFWKEPVRDALGKEHILFLGNYLDPYESEGISAKDALNALWWDQEGRCLLLTALDAVPRERCGDSPFGSPIWSDVEE